MKSDEGKRREQAGLGMVSFRGLSAQAACYPDLPG